MFELPDVTSVSLRHWPRIWALVRRCSPMARTLRLTCSSAMSRASRWSGPDTIFTGRVVAREECVVCGLPVAASTFETLSAAAGLFDPVDFFPLVAEDPGWTPVPRSPRSKGSQLRSWPPRGPHWTS